MRISVRWHHWAIFFENAQGAAVMVNGDRHRAMLNIFFFLEIGEDDMDDILLRISVTLSIQRRLRP